jgi:hypothetical protein
MKITKKAKAEKPHVMYGTSGDGKWWRIDYPLQCPESVIMAGRCQGAKGHKGPHWCYHGDGSYGWEHNKADRKLKGHDIAAGSTPPGHPSYVHPEKMQAKYYLSLSRRKRVTGPKEITRLTRGAIRENEGLTQPVRLDNAPVRAGKKSRKKG